MGTGGFKLGKDGGRENLEISIVSVNHKTTKKLWQIDDTY